MAQQPNTARTKHSLTAREYERAMFNDLYYRFRGPQVRVVPDVRTLRGVLSEAVRQIDVAVYDAGEQRPMLAVECKRYARPLNVKDVESFVGMLEDLSAERGVLVAPLGFSKAAERRAVAAGLMLHRFPERDAVKANWRELARQVYPWDEHYHAQMGDALDALLVDDDLSGCLDSLERLPFEEWTATMTALFQQNSTKAFALLATIAEDHYESEWRFNALQILDQHGALSADFAAHLLERERDHETRELLGALLNLMV